MALSSVAFVACDDYEEPKAPAQSNEQVSILKTSDVTVASAIATEEYDLAKYNQEAANIRICDLTTTELPDTYKLVPQVEISPKGQGAWNVVTSEVEIDAEDPSIYHVYVAPDALQGVYYSTVSKSPVAREIDIRVRFATNLVYDLNGQPLNGNQIAYVGGPDNYYGPFSMTVKPFPADVEFEDDYYLIGTATDGSVKKAIKFSHAGENPYDDPNFTLAYTVTEEMASAGWKWQVIPASTFADGAISDKDYAVWGVATKGEDALEGTLVPQKGGVKVYEGVVSYAGQYLLTINLMNGTYSFTEAIPSFWTPGGGNGWNFDASQQITTLNYADYNGFVICSDSFKLTSAPDWSALYNLGYAGEAGKLQNGSNDNIPVAVPGLYWVTMNLPNLTYSLTEINTIGIIGNATPTGWDASTPLTPSEDKLTWKGTVKLVAGSFKVRANDSWDVNLGGDKGNLQYNQGDLTIQDAGTYDITLSLSERPYTIVLTKK